MTDRRRNAFVLLVVLALLIISGIVIAGKPTRLGLDLKGGVQLVYQGEPTPQVPKVTPEAIDNAINTIRKRTDALGVSEPEIQRSANDQITIGLPDVKNVDRAEQQVGSTAQLQFYDWEPNIYSGPNQLVDPATAAQSSAPNNPIFSLYQAVLRASQSKPRAEATDVPAGGPDKAIVQKFNGNQQQIRQYYDQRNDTTGDQYYLFAPALKGQQPKLISGPENSCVSLLSDYTDKLSKSGPKPAPRPVVNATQCRDQLSALGVAGPPQGSKILKVPKGVIVIGAEATNGAKPGAPPPGYFVVEDDSALSGSDIRNPKEQTDQAGAPNVTFEFSGFGRKQFAATTKRIAQRGAEQILPAGTPPSQAAQLADQRFAITLDNQLISLATVDFHDNPDGIDGRTGAEINNIGSASQARDLAQNLRIGALPINLKLISKTQVSSTLGKQALHQGLIAGAVGLALTLIFLLSFYRVLGLVAALGLVIYAVILFALVKLIPITMTLPGIAGLILTLGVAADANIVIFERIKEEARGGASIPRAISQGYGKALKAIIDANVVTIGVAFILFMLATSSVKGFAFTLLVGTLVSLFTAVLATSAILGSLARTSLLRSKHALAAGKERIRWHFDFMGKSKWFFSMSGLILCAGALAIAGLGVNFGIDFESGTRVTTPVEKAASVAQVRNALAPLGYGDAKIQQVKDKQLGAHVFQITVKKLPPNKVNQVRNALDQKFGVVRANFSADSVGPTFGAQIAKTAIIAIIASLVLISLYIGLRFEFKFAVPVLIALAHDLLITAGVYALFQREVTADTVAALLTILGYSLYDTIIVFDRIRENVPRMPRATFSQIVNRSMAEVLTRSLATSFSTLLPILALMIFGGQTLQDFGFALLVGVASGAYSSIFIAGPVLVHWKEREPVYVRRRQLALEDFGGVVPAYAPGTFGGEQAGEVVETPARRPTRPQRPGQRPGRRVGTPTRGNGPGDGARAGTAVEAPPPVEAPEPEEIEETPVAEEPQEVKEPQTTDGRDDADGADGADRADGADDADAQSSVSSTAGPNRPRKKQQQQRRRKRHGRR
ncbi:MAG TPA: protein translocase subunit SecF [Thermoleophilaceae bacterium]|nr:protein translocase subunit SecF [Thermoleophilaceae bacterium]